MPNGVWRFGHEKRFTFYAAKLAGLAQYHSFFRLSFSNVRHKGHLLHSSAVSIGQPFFCRVARSYARTPTSL